MGETSQNPIQPQGVFLRPTSGLVREARPFDVFIYNLGLISIGIAICLTQSSGSPNYPGANTPLACLFGGILMSAIALGFWMWSIAIPRSGGIYAYVTRGLSPPLGFALSFVDTFTWLFYNALAATFVSSIGLAPLFYVLGRSTNISTFHSIAISLSEPKYQFIVGVAFIILSSLVLIKGIRTFLTLQKILFITAIIGTLTAIIVLLTSNQNDFKTAYDECAKTVQAPLYDAVAQRGSTSSDFSLMATIRLSVWPILSLVGSIFSIAIGGEIQNVRKSQGIGMFGSILFATALLAFMSMYSDKIFGQEFSRGIWISSEDNMTAIPVQPYFPVLIAIVSHNTFLSILTCMGFVAWAFFWIPATLVYAGRTVLAWSLDRVAPPSLGYVNDKLHTPVTAIVTTTIINIIFLSLYLFTDFFASLVLVLAAMLAWIPTMIAGIVYSHRNPRLYNLSAASGMRFMGMPAMIVACTISLVATCFLTYLLIMDPIAAGLSPKSLISISSVFAFALVLYFIMRYVRRRQGHDMNAPFGEIPVE